MTGLKFALLGGLFAVALYAAPAQAHDDKTCFTAGGSDGYIKICDKNDDRRDYAWWDHKQDRDWDRDDHERHDFKDKKHGHHHDRYKNPKVVNYYYPAPIPPGHTRYYAPVGYYGPYYYGPQPYFFNGVRVR